MLYLVHLSVTLANLKPQTHCDGKQRMKLRYPQWLWLAAVDMTHDSDDPRWTAVTGHYYTAPLMKDREW